MTNSEFSNEFDVLYDNITSNQALGLNEYEKSVFLTRAQNEIVRDYFNPKTNKVMEGVDDSQKRQIDFSKLMCSYKSAGVAIEENTFLDSNTNGIYTISWPNNGIKIELSTVGMPPKENKNSISLGTLLNSKGEEQEKYLTSEGVFRVLNETVIVNRGGKKITLQVIPISYTEYMRRNSMPYKRPLKNQAWRIISGNSNKDITLVLGYNDTMSKASEDYRLRYIAYPTPIILEDLTNSGLALEGIQEPLECQLDPEIHHEILQRAVELAKTAYMGDLGSTIQIGNASSTEIGVVSQGNSRQQQ